MANIVINRLSLFGEQKDIDKLLKTVKGEGIIDFNKIIPMPNSLEIEESSLTYSGLEVYKKFISEYIFNSAANKPDLLNIPEESEQSFLKNRDDITPEQWKLGKTAFENKLNFGASTWWDWRIREWGTKWNASNCMMSENNILTFETPWNSAEPIILKLSEMFPSIKFEYCWADENIGYNTGEINICNGEYSGGYHINGSKEAYELSAELWDFSLEDEGYIFDESSGTYEWCDPESEDEECSPEM